MTTPLSAEQLDELERLLALHGVEQRPWKLYDGKDFTYSIFGRHPDEEYDEENLPCRITTGGDFDDIESARLAVTAVNALPSLLATARRERELRELAEQYHSGHSVAGMACRCQQCRVLKRLRFQPVSEKGD